MRKEEAVIVVCTHKNMLILFPWEIILKLSYNNNQEGMCVCVFVLVTKRIC